MQPRGIRNNNPGNIRLGDPWQGLAKAQTDGAFCQFSAPTYGIRALCRVLITYQDKHGLRSIRGIISRWAPPNENNTGAYVEAVAKATRHSPDTNLDMHTYEDLKAVASAIIVHENGRGPEKSLNTWYSCEVMDKGLALAGVEKPAYLAGPVPRTKETLGATTTGALGIGQLAATAPQILSMLKDQQASLPENLVVQVIIGVVLVALAGVIVWGQVKSYQKGLV